MDTVGVDPRGVLILALDGLVLFAIVARSLWRSYDHSDRGRGSIVALEAPLRPSYRRCAAFLLIALVGSVALVGMRSPDPTVLYDHLVGRLLLLAVPSPAAVAGYTAVLLPVIPVTGTAFFVSMAVVLDASLGRRLTILADAVVFLLLSSLVDAALGVFVVRFGAPLGPTPLLSLLLQYAVAAVMLLALQFQSFQLPNLTPIPLRRGHDWGDSTVVGLCTLLGLAAAGVLIAVVVKRFADHPLLIAVVALSSPPFALASSTLFLGVFRVLTRRRCDPGPDRPPIDVIIPAYNEVSVVGALLRSIDAAAQRYGGPVHVILCDDGSTDSTRQVALEAMGDFRNARGEVIAGAHSGKSAALNRALLRCSSEIVFRIDADCVVDVDCFVYAVPWFLARPDVGLVSCLMLPKEPYLTWIDRMRFFENIGVFGFTRPASDVVDGIFCVQGNFTGFRRAAAVEVGGFIEGMYGEDVEFTYAITRLGYRVEADTRIVCYEDVPNTARQLRIQRTRWYRGGVMAYARHVPFVTGLAGPRIWFFATRQALRRALTPFRLALTMYLVAHSVLHPDARINLGRLLAVLVIRSLPAAVLSFYLAAYYGKLRVVLWMPLQAWFVLVKHWYALEGFLSFSCRAVTAPLHTVTRVGRNRAVALVESVD